MGKSEHKNKLWYLIDSKLLTSLPYRKKKQKNKRKILEAEDIKLFKLKTISGLLIIILRYLIIKKKR